MRPGALIGMAVAATLVVAAPACSDGDGKRTGTSAVTTDASRDTGGDGSGGRHGDAGAGGAIACSGLAEAACGASQASGCEGVFGSTAASPSGERRYAGCRTTVGTAARACAAAPACGVSPQSGECWEFTNGCVPDGWIASFDPTRWPADCDEIPSDCPAHCQCQRAAP